MVTKVGVSLDEWRIRFAFESAVEALSQAIPSPEPSSNLEEADIRSM